MGLATLNAKLSAVVTNLTDAADAADALGQSVRRNLSVFREEMAKSKSSNNSAALKGLLGNEATQGLMESYMLMLAVNPSHPDLPKVKQGLRDWSNVDESFFTWVERFFKDAYREKQKLRRRRGQGASVSDDPASIVSDFTNMVQLGKL